MERNKRIRDSPVSKTWMRPCKTLSWLEGVRLDRKGIEHVLERPHAKDNEHEFVRIPMSSLPEGLTQEQAQDWIERAIKAYRKA